MVLISIPQNVLLLGFDIKAGKKWLEEMIPVDNELYELEQKLT